MGRNASIVRKLFERRRSGDSGKRLRRVAVRDLKISRCRPANTRRSSAPTPRSLISRSILGRLKPRRGTARTTRRTLRDSRHAAESRLVSYRPERQFPDDRGFSQDH